MSFVETLTKLGCLQVSVNPLFTYASGLKGPLYCDNRKIISHIKERKTIISGMKDLIEKNSLKYEAIAGLATAGIAHGAWLSDLVQSPFCYVRSKPKAHGKGNQIEGDVQSGATVLMIEDLVNQGSSLELAIRGVRGAGFKVTDCISIVDYQMPRAKEVLSRTGINLHSLVRFEDIMDYCKQKNKLSSNELKLVAKWHSDPENFFV